MYRSVLTEVKVGQVVAAPSYNPKDWRVLPLVNTGVTINHGILSHLLNSGVKNIWIDHKDTSEIDSQIDIETLVVLRQFSADISKFYFNRKEKMNYFKAGGSDGRKVFIDYNSVASLVRPVIETLRSDPHRIVAVQSLARLLDKDIDRMLMRTLFCICLALEMEGQIFAEKFNKLRKLRRNLAVSDYQSARDHTSMAVASLILNMYDAHLMVNKGWATPQKIDSVTQYLESEMKNFSEPVVRMILRMQKQNYDGSGEPKSEREMEDGKGVEIRGLKAMEIHLLSRLNRVCDVFVDHLLEDNSYLHALSRLQHEALNRLDPLLVETFLRMIYPFPLGSQVVLNSGEVMVVLRQNKRNPCRPLLYRIYGQDSDEKFLDLDNVPLTTVNIEISLDAPSIACMDHYFSNISVPLY